MTFVSYICIRDIKTFLGLRGNLTKHNKAKTYLKNMSCSWKLLRMSS